MAPRDRQERERQAMHAEIVATALAMVRAEGPANLSLRRVAERLEYTPAALYRYFPDKAALVQAVCDEGFASLTARLHTVPNDLSSPAALLTGCLTYLGFARDEPHLYTLMFVDMLPGQRHPTQATSPGRPTDSPAFATLVESITRGVEDGSFRLAPTAVLATALGAWALLHGYAMLAARFGGLFGVEAIRMGLEAFIAGLVAGTATPAPAPGDGVFATRP